MTKAELYKELSYVNHSREKRLKYANLVIDYPELIPPLLDILFGVDNEKSCRAAWVFEFMCSKNIETIIPFLDVFTKHMSKVHLDSAVRPVAKICELITKTYYGKDDSKIKDSLTSTHKERLIETCFDWMINDEKVAPKAYSMVSLNLLGTEFDWVHTELVIILERDFQMQSAAFKARARHILKKIKKA
ncbi:adenylosuccinate lyase [Winogradskyella bathintestinalis]|uniref:Adenylosuccinate lyase n=1 Tax=Winogradskyella bathintestinalis TaxID=3035208 RepID=A0ABT7ZVG2_9FLAO|nr:adenylosuccinate lyase [Winogradskyella bathintestinalis]MDN3493021.1 adenylosuccinate lyase [Winogradskyella bathintestinalis]